MPHNPNTMESEQLTTADLANLASGHNNPQEPDKPENGGPGSHDQYSGPLLAPDFSAEMRTRWETIQTGFVDDPQISVQQADELVASAIKKLAESFAEERNKLEQEWSKGNDVSTENLRQALRRYRAFFHRLLSI
jgi:membrane peptidoglycan carboxypeptidase